MCFCDLLFTYLVTYYVRQRLRRDLLSQWQGRLLIYGPACLFEIFCIASYGMGMVHLFPLLQEKDQRVFVWGLFAFVGYFGCILALLFHALLACHSTVCTRLCTHLFLSVMFFLEYIFLWKLLFTGKTLNVGAAVTYGLWGLILHIVGWVWSFAFAMALLCYEVTEGSRRFLNEEQEYEQLQEQKFQQASLDFENLSEPERELTQNLLTVHRIPRAVQPLILSFLGNQCISSCSISFLEGKFSMSQSSHQLSSIGSEALPLPTHTTVTLSSNRLREHLNWTKKKRIPLQEPRGLSWSLWCLGWLF